MNDEIPGSRMPPAFGSATTTVPQGEPLMARVRRGAQRELLAGSASEPAIDSGAVSPDPSSSGAGPRKLSAVREVAARRAPVRNPSGEGFGSILFLDAGRLPTPAEPQVLSDLNLDQVISALVKGREEYDLGPLLSAPLGDLDTLTYRQGVFRDLESDPVRAAVESFAGAMRWMRRALGFAEKLHNETQRARWHLDAAREYCRAVPVFVRELDVGTPRSDGLRSLLDHVRTYVASDRFQGLSADVHRLASQLDEVTYCVFVEGSRVTVGPYSGEVDYGSEIEATFRRFPRGVDPNRQFRRTDWEDMDSVEEQIQERVARLFPDVFGTLRGFPVRHANFADPVLVRFDREVEFYLAYLELVHRFRAAGLGFCYPEVSDRSKQVEVREAYDLALAQKLVKHGVPVVVNDVQLTGAERVAVVSGPNNGGKTTFARMFGQLHYLARLGGPIPGTSARLYLSDRIFTHFERVERLTEMRGKLMDELVRVREIFRDATERSVIILNETFASATVHDALFLGRKVLDVIRARDALCVYVTFLDELSTLGPETVSVVSQVSPDDPETRTFRLLRQPADGRAYATTLARKYGLTYDRLRSRVAP